MRIPGLYTDQWWMSPNQSELVKSIRPSEIPRNVRVLCRARHSSWHFPPVVANCMWMPSDFTSSNGATEVVAGSHLTGAHSRSQTHLSNY